MVADQNTFNVCDMIWSADEVSDSVNGFKEDDGEMKTAKAAVKDVNFKNIETLLKPEVKVQIGANGTPRA